MLNGKPTHGAANDQQAAQILKDELAYAKKRWGCTLFYIDSTVAVTAESLDPDVFKAVADANPDVLLIPENESMRYFAYSAPLNSYVHHKVTSTPVGARMVYPKAFSVLMAPDGDRPEDHNALVTAVRHGDILLFNGWYSNNGAQNQKTLRRSGQATEVRSQRSGRSEVDSQGSRLCKSSQLRTWMFTSSQTNLRWRFSRSQRTFQQKKNTL